jgi:outer membrane cobalamin receptor
MVRRARPLAAAAAAAVCLAVRLPAQAAEGTAGALAARAGLVTVLSGANLRAAGLHTLAEALREAAGVEVVASGAFGGGDATVRGFGGGPEGVLVRWDGVPLNVIDEPAELAGLTLDGVERIEIRSGVAADLAGAGAETMIVDVRTFAPDSRRRAWLEGWSGSDATILGRAGAASRGRLGGAWAAGSLLRTDGGLVSGESYSRRSGGAGLEVSDGRTFLRAALDAGWSRYDYQGADMGMPPLLVLLPASGIFLDQAQVGTVTTLSLEAGTRLTDRVGVRVLLGRHSRGRRYGATYQGTMPVSTSDVYAQHGAAARSHYEAEAAFALSPRVSGAIGVEQDNANVTDDDTTFFGGPTGSVSWQARRMETRRTAVRLSVSGAVGSWSFVAGVRRDDPRWLASATTWRALVERRLGAASRVHVGARTGYRPWTGTDGPAAPDLRNETSRSLEAGIEQELAGGRASVSLTGLEQRFDDIIGLYPLAAGVSFTPLLAANLGAARGRGWELAAVWRPLASASLAASWTHVPVKIVSVSIAPWVAFQQGEPLVDRASDVAVAAATLRLGRAGLADVRLRSIGRREALNLVTLTRDTLQSYTVVDVGARFPVTRWLQVSARGENLLDERYVERDGYAVRGRSVTLGVRLGPP